MAIHNEYVFEHEICAELKNRGWLLSTSDAGYDRELALFPEDVFAWLEESQPDQWRKIVKPGDSETHQTKAKNDLLQRLAKTLDTSLSHGGGTLEMLRKGFKASPAKFEMCQFKPADGSNPGQSDLAKSKEMIKAIIGGTLQEQLNYLLTMSTVTKWLANPTYHTDVATSTWEFASIVEVCDKCNKGRSIYEGSYQFPRTANAEKIYQRFSDSNSKLYWP